MKRLQKQMRQAEHDYLTDPSQENRLALQKAMIRLSERVNKVIEYSFSKRWIISPESLESLYDFCHVNHMTFVTLNK